MDLTPEQIRAAREAGIIPDAQAEALLARRGEVQPDTPEAAPLIGDEENLRFLRSFSDIFITIGVGLVMAGVFSTASALDPRGLGWGLFGAALAFWALSEFFGRVRRAHLPTLVLSLGFALALGGGLAQFYADRLVSVGRIGADWFVPAALFLAGMALYYWRIRLPFCLALLAWGTVVFVFGVSGSLGLIGGLWTVIALLLLCAVGAFAAALAYDVRDPERIMRWSDNGFWLHTVASPLLLLSFLALGAKLTLGVDMSDLQSLRDLPDNVDRLSVWMGVVIVAAMALGLAVNRRVFVVSTLLYALVLVTYGLSKTDLSPSLVASTGLLVVGGLVVFLGVGWHPARRALLRLLPDWKIFPRPLRTDI